MQFIKRFTIIMATLLLAPSSTSLPSVCTVNTSSGAFGEIRDTGVRYTLKRYKNFRLIDLFVRNATWPFTRGAIISQLFPAQEITTLVETKGRRPSLLMSLTISSMYVILYIWIFDFNIFLSRSYPILQFCDHCGSGIIFNGYRCRTCK